MARYEPIDWDQLQRGLNYLLRRKDGGEEFEGEFITWMPAPGGRRPVHSDLPEPARAGRYRAGRVGRIHCAGDTRKSSQVTHSPHSI